jgi:FemAB family protein
MIDLKEICDRFGLEIASREDQTWEAVFDTLAYRSTRYLSSSIDYQLAYHRGLGGEWLDYSSILLSDGKPVGLWPITVFEKDGTFNLTSQGAPILAPLFTNSCAVKTQKRINNACWQVVGHIATQLGLSDIVSAPAFDGRHDLTFWHLALAASEAQCTVQQQLYVNLGLATDEIRSRFRKSYRQLVNKGERLWRIEIIDHAAQENVWEEFKALHRHVAGRVTRSSESWNLQLAAINRRHAFLISLRDPAGTMVGGGFFPYSADEGRYGVGAYDRSLFDMPLGHVVQARAIEKLKGLGCKWYHIGRKFLPTDEPSPTPKEVTISDFKAGFATHRFPTFLLKKNIHEQN